MSDNKEYDKWLQGSIDRDVIIRTFEGKEVRAEPDTGYRAQTAILPSVGTLSLYVDTDYIGSYRSVVIFKALDIATILEVDINFTLTIKGLLKTIRQKKIK